MMTPFIAIPAKLRHPFHIATRKEWLIREQPALMVRAISLTVAATRISLRP
jgi:hypothetical protein